MSKEVRRMVEVDIHVRGLEEPAAQSRTHLAQSLSLFNSTTQSLSFYLEPAGGTMMYAKVLYNLYTTNTAAPSVYAIAALGPTLVGHFFLAKRSLWHWFPIS